jgi:TRAP-type C4-dicarboxylate transport system substrate-binding protein
MIGLVYKLAACALALGAMAGAAQAETVLRFSNWLPPAHPLIKDVVKPWSEQVAEATDGRVRLQILNAPLGPPQAHYDLVATGGADVALSVHTYTPGRFTLTRLPELPFLTPSAEAASVAYWRLHRRMLAAHGEHAGVKLLALFVHGPGHLFTVDQPVTPVEALEGAKIRVAGQMTDRLAGQLGMVPLQASSTKAYELLSNGIADGIFFPSESIPFFNLDDVVTDALRVPGGLYNVSFFVVMNQARWDALPERDKAAIDSVSGEALARLAGRAWDAADAAGNETLQGVVDFHDATKAEMETIEAAADALYQQVRDEVEAEGVDFDAAIALLREEAEKVATE